jgi:hypothetical protein
MGLFVSEFLTYSMSVIYRLAGSTATFSLNIVDRIQSSMLKRLEFCWCFYAKGDRLSVELEDFVADGGVIIVLGILFILLLFFFFNF